MYLEFASQNWYLFALFGILASWLLVDIFKGDALGIKSIDPSLVAHLQSREDAQIIDLRSKDEYKRGHIASAINLPSSELENSLIKLKKMRDKPVILYCQLGRDSFKAAQMLQKNDFSRVHMLKGGMDSWKNEGLPLISS